jgi:hypothetical protein
MVARGFTGDARLQSMNLVHAHGHAHDSGHR